MPARSQSRLPVPRLLLARLVTSAGYWRAVRLSRISRLRGYRAQLAVRGAARRRAVNAGDFTVMAGRSLLTSVGALALLAASEAFAVVLARFAPAFLASGGRLASYSFDFEALVGPVVGGLASFLALYFATVGVVASTAYSTAPADVRRLFLTDRAGQTFVRNVVRALVIGIAILTLRIVDYVPHATSLFLLGALTIVAVTSLAALSVELFNFFDVSTLARPLRSRLRRAVRVAQRAKEGLLGDARVVSARGEAERVFASQARISFLLSVPGQTNRRGATTLGRSLLSDWAHYASAKRSIAVAGAWYKPAPAYKNWLAMGTDEKRMYIRTRTAPPVSSEPDFLWVERHYADRIGNLLRATLDASSWTDGTTLAQTAITVIKGLTGQLQIEAALLLLRTVSKELDIAAQNSSKEPILDGVESPNELALWATRKEALLDLKAQAVLQAWLAFVRSVEALGRSRAAKQGWVQLVEGSGLPDQSGIYFRDVLVELQRLRAGVGFERFAEGARITPDWYINHRIARALNDSIVGATNTLLQEGRAALIVDVLGGEPGSTDFQLIFAGLEFYHKAQTHISTIRSALEALSVHRTKNLQEADWKELSSESLERAVADEKALINLLSQRLPAADWSSFNSSKSDEFGQAYQYVLSALFDSILNRDRVFVESTLPALIQASYRARERVLRDYSAGDNPGILPLSLSFILDVMEMSGYTAAVDEVQNSGLWHVAKAAWDSLFDAVGTDGGEIIRAQLVAVLHLKDSLSILQPPSIDRRQREIDFEQHLRREGIDVDQDAAAVYTSQSIAKTVSGGGWIPSQYDYVDVFAVLYLMATATEEDDYPRSARDLRAALYAPSNDDEE